MNRISKTAITTVASILTIAGAAYAEDVPATTDQAAAQATTPAEPVPSPVAAVPASGAFTKETWPTALNARPLTLAKGMVQVHADAFLNLSKDHVFEPVAIAPDIYYGVSDKLSVGLTHNLGLCLTGTTSGCEKLYNDVGFDAVFDLKRDANMDLAVHGGIDVLRIADPSAIGLRVGASFKYVTGKLGIYLDPSLKFGLNHREIAVGLNAVAFNKETVSVPVTLAYQVNDKLAPYLRTGLDGFGFTSIIHSGAPFSDFGALYVIPLGVGALYGVSNKLDVGAEFIFPGITGGDAASSDARYVNLFVNLRL